jgi:hypothetical protein
MPFQQGLCHVDTSGDGDPGFGRLVFPLLNRTLLHRQESRPT